MDLCLENDISKIKPGLNVIVRLDALPSVPFHGKINNVSKVCIKQDDKKVFPDRSVDIRNRSET